jgi:hypothetical protein
VSWLDRLRGRGSGGPPPPKAGQRVLHDLLRARGIDPTRPASVGETWEVFKEFAAIPFATEGPDSDGVLFQTGTFDFYGQDEFYLDFLRQFELVDRRGEHDHYEQLHCEFRFPVTDTTRSFGRFHQWWFPDDDAQGWADFAALVEHRPEFIALRSIAPQAAKIEQEVV